MMIHSTDSTHLNPTTNASIIIITMTISIATTPPATPPAMTVPGIPSPPSVVTSVLRAHTSIFAVHTQIYL